MAGIIVVALCLAWLILCNCVPLCENSACAEVLSHGDFDECLCCVALVSLSLKMQKYYHQENASLDCCHIDFLSALSCFQHDISYHTLFPLLFSFFLFVVFFPHIYSSLRGMPGRRIRHCHPCPLCSRYLAFLTSMEASWLGRSLHC